MSMVYTPMISDNRERKSWYRINIWIALKERGYSIEEREAYMKRHNINKRTSIKYLKEQLHEAKKERLREVA